MLRIQTEWRFGCFDTRDELPGSYQHMSALSQWRWLQGVIHCYEILFNNIKSVRWKQISSLWAGVSGWQHSSPSGSGGASARRTSVRTAGRRGTWQNHISPCWRKRILLVRSLHAITPSLTDAGDQPCLKCHPYTACHMMCHDRTLIHRHNWVIRGKSAEYDGCKR